jgi:hypothetical protein
MAKLSLSFIQLRPVVRRTVETLAEAETKSFLPVEIRLRNTGSKTLYFIARPRVVRYDAETRRLSLQFEEPDPANLVRPDLRVPPRIQSLEPGYESTLVAEVPLRLKVIRTRERVDRAVVESDLSDVSSVTCRIAYADTQFARRRGEAARDMVRRLHAWGERAELTVQDSIPPADGGVGYKSQQGERSDDADTE